MTAPPLVFVPGCGRGPDDVDALRAALGGRDVIVPALRGRRGGADGPPPASAEEAAAFVAADVADRGIERFLVGGHSYGGAIALALALARRDATATRTAPAWDARGADDEGPRRGVVGLALVSTGARLRVAPPILAAFAADPVASSDWRACDRFDRLQDVGAVAVPTVIIVGADDVLTPPKYARFLADRIDGSRLFVVDGAGHDVHVTHAPAVAAAIAGLWDDVA